MREAMGEGRYRVGLFFLFAAVVMLAGCAYEDDAVVLDATHVEVEGEPCEESEDATQEVGDDHACHHVDVEAQNNGNGTMETRADQWVGVTDLDSVVDPFEVTGDEEIEAEEEGVVTLLFAVPQGQVLTEVWFQAAWMEDPVFANVPPYEGAAGGPSPTNGGQPTP